MQIISDHSPVVSATRRQGRNGATFEKAQTPENHKNRIRAERFQCVIHVTQSSTVKERFRFGAIISNRPLLWHMIYTV